MTYIWCISEEYPERLVGEYQYDRSVDPYVFKNGGRVGDISEKPHIIFTARMQELKKYDCLCNCTLLPLVNQKVQSILNDICADCIELFDAVIQCEDGDLEGYSIVNVIKRVEALDRENSDFNLILDSDSIMGFNHLAYNQKAMSDQGDEIARDADYLPHILVGDQFLSAFKEGAVTGVRLITDDQYNAKIHSLYARD